MTSQTTSTTSPACLVHRLGLEFSEVVASFEANFDGAPDEGEREFDRINAIEDQVSYLQAPSLAGIQFQIMVALGEASVFSASEDNYNSRASLRRAGRCMGQALKALEVLSGVPREEMAGHFLCRRDLDPISQAA